MGILLWAVLTGLACMAGVRFTLRVLPAATVGEQLVGGCLTATVIVLGALLGLGYAGVLYPGTVAVAVVMLSAAAFAVSLPRRGLFRAFGRRLRAAASSAVATPVTAVATALALGLVAVLGTCIWLLPTWGWDAMWYHDAISAYAFQEHSLGWVATHVPFINSYPKNVELLALWNALFAPDDRLLDGAQLPLVLMGTVALAAIIRRAGASAPIAWGLGLLWLFTPAVFLNAPSDYVDAGGAAFWLAAVLFLCRARPGVGNRIYGVAALALYAGSKVTGMLHAVLLAPWVLVALVRDPTARGRRWAEGVGLLALFTALGGAPYLRNWVRTANPVWPAQVPIPFTKRALNGSWAIGSFTTPPFGGADDLGSLAKSFTELKPYWFVDVRTGGFGWLWLFVLLPLLGVVLGWLAFRVLRRRGTPGGSAAAVLAGTALVTPARWWPRYTLGFPAAGLVATGLLLSRVRSRRLQLAALAAMSAAAAVQGWMARTGLFGRETPSILTRALGLSWSQRAAMPLDLWQQAQADQRETRVQPGEASIYDDSVSFVYPLWRNDWKNRVLYLPFQPPASAWLQRLRDERARWAAVSRDGPAAQVLKEAGWEKLYGCYEGCDVWVRP